MGARYRSSIPAGVTEQTVSEYRREGSLTWLRKVNCLLGGVVVGERYYDQDGTLSIETPMRDEMKHGLELHWYDGGERLQFAEPFHNGLPHGIARQWAEDGTLIGTYALKHGTGYDLWRCLRCDDQSVYLAEVYSLRRGERHGYEWWLNEDQRSVFIERHWCENQIHGIEREWNSNGRLHRGFPRYYHHGVRMSKRQYLSASRHDPGLPAFREEDNEPFRRFPPAVSKELTR